MFSSSSNAIKIVPTIFNDLIMDFRFKMAAKIQNTIAKIHTLASISVYNINTTLIFAAPSMLSWSSNPIRNDNQQDLIIEIIIEKCKIETLSTKTQSSRPSVTIYDCLQCKTQSRKPNKPYTPATTH